MTLKFSSAFRLAPSFVVSSIFLIAVQTHADTYYWDNLAGPGFGTAGGTWSAPTAGPIPGWNTDPSGAAAPGSVTTVTTDDINFGTSLALAAGTITVSGTVGAGDITYGSASGAIVLSGGTVNLPAAGLITTNSVVGSVHSIATTLSGAGTSLTKAGVGAMALTTTNTAFNPGEIIIGGGILRIGSNTATQLNGGLYAGNISISNGAILQIWSSSAQTLSGTISGAGALNKAYGGALTLSGPNTYTGKSSFVPQTTAGFQVNVSSFNSVNGGNPPLATSSLGRPTTIANGTIDVGSGSAQANVTLNYTGSGETTDRVLNISFNGTATQTISASGSGLLTFSSAPTANLSSGSRELVLTGTGTGAFTQALPQLTAGGLFKSGAGTWTFGGANTYSGPTRVTAGTLILDNARALQNSPLDTLNGIAGTASAGLKTTASTLVLGGITGNKNLASVFTTTSGGYSGVTDLSLNPVSGATHIYSAVIADGAAGMTLTKTGAGTQLLNGTNTYTGATTVSAGTLGGSGTIPGIVNVAATAGLSPGASTGTIGTLTLSSNSASALTLDGSNLISDLPASGTTSDLVAVTGGLVFNGTNTVLLGLPAGNVPANTYSLMSYNAKSGSGSAVFANGLTTLGNASLAVNDTNIQLTVGAGGLNHSVWSGATGNWDTGTNWTRNGTANSAFVAGDFVTFDDTGTTLTVTGGTVLPTSVTANNSTAKTYVILATIGGANTPLVKNGTGTFTLGSTTVFPLNSYSGGTVVNAGILNLAGASNSNVDARLGDAAGGITLNGGQLKATSTNVSGARDVTVGAAGGSLFVNKNNNFTTSGILTGAGTLNLLDGGGSGTLSTYNFNSTSNDFTGGLVLNNAILNIGSLDDSTNDIVINSNTSSATGNVNSTPGLKYNSGAASALTLSSRAIEFNSAVTSAILIQNNNISNAITISSDLVASGAGTKNLMLDAAAGPTNVFDGDISDGPGGGTVGVVKPSTTGASGTASTSVWVLSGNNSYTGATAINTGTLAGIGANAFGNTSGISIAAAGILSLRGDSTTTFANSNLTTSASGPTINVDRATIAGTAAKTMTIGTLGTSSTAATYQLNFTGANNTGLSAGTVTTPTTGSATTNTINNVISGGGKLTLAGINLGGTAGGTLVFSNNGDTTVSGPIAQAGTSQALTKNGNGKLTINGINTYTGLTTVSAGTLGGSGTIAGNMTVAASASLAPGASAGTLTVAGDLNISAPAGGSGKLEFELDTIAASDKIEVGGTLIIGTGALGLGDFDFTDLGGLQSGTYTLISSPSPISGTLAAGDVNGTLGTATLGLQISASGTDLELVVFVPPLSATAISITRKDANPTNASSVSWDVTFDGPVSGLTSSNFSLSESGLSGSAIASVTGSGTEWVVTASNTGGCGTLGLTLANDTGVTPELSNEPFPGETYMIDTIKPVISCAKQIVVTVPEGGSANVSYAPTAHDVCDPMVIVVCDPPSGSSFGVGNHVVECTATDSAGNVGTASFNVVVLVQQPVNSERTLEGVSVRGDDAEGTGVAPGATILAINNAFLNNGGDVVFDASLQGNGANNSAVFHRPAGGTPAPVAVKGASFGAGSYGIFSHLSLNDADDIGFQSLTSGNLPGHFTGPGAGPVANSARRLGASPSGGVYNGLYQPALASNGELLTPAALLLGNGGVTSLNDSVITSSAGTVVAREGSPSGIGAINHGQFLARVVASDADGRYAFPSLISESPPTGGNAGIFVGQLGGSPTLAVRKGDAAAGTPGTFSSFLGESVNSDGEIALRAFAIGGGITAADNEGIWTNSGNASAPPVLVAREGDVAPCIAGGMVAFSSFGTIYMGDDGSVCFLAYLKDSDAAPFAMVNASNDASIWLWRNGALDLIVREGDLANSTDGAVVGRIVDFDSNGDADGGNGIAYSVEFAPISGDTTSRTNQAVYVDRGGEDLAPVLVLRRGDKFTVGEDEVDVLSLRISSAQAYTPSGSTGGFGRAINGDGDVLLNVGFTGSKSGIFVLGSPPVVVPD